MYGFLKLCNVYMYYCVHVYVHMIKRMRSCQYVYLACNGCRDRLYGFFSEASLILDKASLQDLQNLEGKSAVPLLMSISKHVLSSTEKLAQLYVVS